MVTALLLFLVACDGGSKDDSSGGGGTGDDSATPDDTGTEVPDDSATGDDSGCPEVAWYQDGDKDGFGTGDPTMACDAPGQDWVRTDGDCDDALAEVSPEATETCNAIDDDCDAAIDDKDDSVDAPTWYRTPTATATATRRVRRS
jgi:hypothetical protein